ncbi:MAG: hypothetical protein LAT76_01595 [Schleiferiaceae bacterium]|nr:hypothetical protein [Schleiferiaceae bacterium]
MKVFRRNIIFFLLATLFVACGLFQGNYYRPQRTANGLYLFLEVATDSLYGYHPDTPIKIGGFKKQVGEQNIYGYLGSITSTKPNEFFNFQRVGGCCEFRHPDGFAEIAFLDVYKLYFPKKDSSVVLFFDTYNLDTLKIAKGFRSL